MSTSIEVFVAISRLRSELIVCSSIRPFVAATSFCGGVLVHSAALYNILGCASETSFVYIGEVGDFGALLIFRGLGR